MRKIIYLVLLLVSFHIAALPPEVELAARANKAIHEKFTYEASPWVIKSPLQTFLDGSGDCADLSAFLVSLLGESGITAVMGVIIIKLFSANHAVVVMSTDPNLSTTSDFATLKNTWILDPTTGQTYASIYMRSHLAVFTLDHQALLSNWGE